MTPPGAGLQAAETCCRGRSHRLIVTLGPPREAAQDEDRTDGAGQRDGDPAEGEVERPGGVQEHEGADDRDRGAGAQRGDVDAHPVSHARVSAARSGAVSSWKGPGPNPVRSMSAVSLLMTRS